MGRIPVADHRAPTWQLPGEPRAPLWIGTGVETGGGFVELAQQLPDPPAGIVAPCCRLWARSVDERESAAVGREPALDRLRRRVKATLMEVLEQSDDGPAVGTGRPVDDIADTAYIRLPTPRKAFAE